MSAPVGILFSKSALVDLINLEKQWKCTLINAFWPNMTLLEQDYISEDYAAFFDFLGRTLQGLRPHATKFAIQDLDGLLEMVCVLREHRTLSRKHVAEIVSQNYLNTGHVAVALSIELTVRLWLGINVSSKALSVGPRNSRDSRIEWRDDESLDQMVTARFKHPATGTTHSEFPLDESFTAANLKSICRLRIRWTDNLLDHLRLEGRRGHRSLSIYRQRISLINHRKGSEPTMIPAEILDEAIRTLDLLFPFGDPKTEQLLE